MKRWFGTLFARVLLVQGGLVLLVVLLFGVFAMRQQSQTLARATAPVWAAALAPVLHNQTTLPHDAVVPTKVSLLPGPPPEDSAALPVYPRFKAFATALRDQGVPVVSVRVSGRTGEAITWLEIEQGGATRWVGVRGEFEGIDLRERGTLGFAIGLLAVLAGAWWLSRRVLQPVAELSQAMHRFEAEGQLPSAVNASAPLELRELSLQFARLARQRHDQDEERRTMLAAISHDLRSPLGRIRLAAELLPEAEGVAQRREAIVRNVQVADRLLGSFIDMARADDETISGRVDLRALVQELADSEPDIRLLEVPATPCWLQPASSVALERALRNLIDNARRHGAAPIDLGLLCDDETTALWVRDHGPGIDPALREQLQQPFARGESSRLTPGTGLGLAIAQRTAKRHGGRLVLSDAAPGLRVALRLQRCEERE
jgi:two-component system, OmpR family, osmolarity sensor histidine kinase EnvZ